VASPPLPQTSTPARARRGGRGSPWRRIATLLGPYAAAALVLLVLQRSGLVQSANLILYDLSVWLRPTPDGATTPVRVIGIDEEDLRQLGWPLNDALLIRAIERLDRAGAAAIGLDLYRDIGVGDAHAALRELSRRNPHLVSVFSHVDGIAAIRGTPVHRQAYNDLVVDSDDVVRRDLLFVRGMGPAMVPLPLRMLEVGHGGLALREAFERDPGWVRPLEANSGGYHHLDHGGVQRMLGFHRPGSFPTWSLRALLAGQVPERSLRGSLVLIGSNAPSLRDGFRVPFQPPQPGRSLRMAGVDLHAHRLAALIALQEGRPLGLRAASPWLNTSLLVAAVLAGLLLGEGIGGLRRSQTTVLAVAAAMVVATGVSLASGWWFDAASPLAALAALAAAAWTRRAQEQQQQRQELQGLLQQTTSTSVAHELWRERELVLEGGRFPGRMLELTVLFTDIEHFTRVSEQLDPEALLAWLNRGMAAMVGPVQEQGGLVNKFTGDGLLAVFGAPLDRGTQLEALAAVHAAAGIRRALQRLNAQLSAEGLPAMRVRLGVHTGPVLAGSVGTPERWEFGVVGDTVNCAARLEGLHHDQGHSPTCRVLLSGTSLALVREGIQGPWKRWGTLPLSGRSTAVEVWELLDEEEPVAGSTEERGPSASQRTDS
jgi:adenylate cyclase